MRFSALFHPECAPVAVDGGSHYVVLSALQWKTPNLDLMKTACKQRFAVLYNQPLEDRFAIETLEQAHIQGAMSGVKLVAVHKDVLRIFLSDEVAGSTFPTIEALWEPIRELELNRRLKVDFSGEHEAYTGRTDYLFWSAVKEVLESNSLGIEQYQIPVLHDCADEVLHGDSWESHVLHVDIRQSLAPQPVEPYQMCSTVSSGANTGHSACLMAQYYVKPLNNIPDA
ncbi:UNVERIFIED_ORG: hypothetical protein J2W65_002481 [Pseudomonas parafulva]|nr:hypothetical protein [Pseudomonas parafulva]